MLFTDAPDCPLGSLAALVDSPDLPDPSLAQAAADFLSHNPNSSPPPEAPAVWLLQGEAALVACSGAGAAAGGAAAPEWVGSTDATTCVVVAARCPETGLVWCCHLDATPGPAAAEEIRALLCERMRAPQIYLVSDLGAPGAGDMGSSFRPQ
ncbi:hypothetical protein MNEG_13414, partial [Monoraphidium neglectum]